jgi:hypothetical protein
MLTESVRRNVYGLTGLFTVADLPTPGTKRWVIRRKAEVVAAVRGGLLSLELACSRYALSAEEFLSWQETIDRHGFAALRVTRLGEYRQRHRRSGQHSEQVENRDSPCHPMCLRMSAACLRSCTNTD